MNTLARLCRLDRWFRLQLPAAMLIALLQRTPVVRLLTLADEVVTASPVGTVLRSAAALAASLGALHSLAGATTLSATQASPVNVNSGAQVNIAFTVTNTINIMSWKIGGTLPPGLTLVAREGGASLTGPGTLDATTPGMGDPGDPYGGGGTPGISSTTPLLTGTVTQAGTYTFSLQAYEFAGLTGLASNSFNYTVTVAAAAAPPSISTQPQSKSVNAGDTVTLTAAASGTPTPTYQWQKNGANIPGATDATYTISAAAVGDAGNYTLVATNSAGSVTSSAAVVSVTATVVNVTPTFSTQPKSQSVAPGASVTFTAAASGTPAPTYQWQKNGTNIPGATNATFTIAAAAAGDVGNYTVVATNSAGAVTSTPVALSVTTTTAAPTIAAQPVTQTVLTGSTAVFNVAVTASPAPTYQWRKNGNNIAGATTATLLINNASAADAASYSAVVTNSAGSVTSSTASLAISSAANFGHLINLSIITNITTATPQFSVGAVVGGGGTTGAKPLLLRAVGPSLSAFGVGSPLADSKLDLLYNGASAGTNDNWGGDNGVTTVGAAVGAFPFASASSKDAAINLPTGGAGSYALQVSGVGGATGTVLAELYDASSLNTFNAATPRLINVSVIKTLAAGESLSAGFVIGGNTSRTVLIRAVGPALGAFGVPGTMADPKLDLISSGTTLASNDNWGGDAQLNTISSVVGAFPITDGASKDAVLLVTLAPGSYSAQVTGVNNTGGSVLVEVYEVP